LHAETFPRPLRPRGKAYQTGWATACRYCASESTLWTGGRPLLTRTSWQNEEQVLDMLLIRLSLVGVYRQEDGTFPTQQCTHACIDIASIHTGQRKYRHYSLRTGNIAYRSVDGWWRDQVKMPSSSHVCCGLKGCILLKWKWSTHTKHTLLGSWKPAIYARERIRYVGPPMCGCDRRLYHGPHLVPESLANAHAMPSSTKYFQYY
jgi:hypothetical protein